MLHIRYAPSAEVTGHLIQPHSVRRWLRRTNILGRPQLERAIDALGTDDVFVIAEWDRATRSMMDGIKIIQRVADRGATVRVLDKPWLGLTTPMGKGILAFLSALAEDERERIASRAHEGRVAAVARGVKFGPKPKLTEHQRKVAVERLINGESARSIGKDMGVAHTTIMRLTVNPDQKCG